MEPGQLVMAVGPLAVLHGPQDAMPSPDALADLVASRWPHLPREHRALLAAMHGAGRGGAEPVAKSEGAEGQPAASGEGGQADAAAADGVDVHALVSYNAYGDAYEDLPAADLRGATPRSCVGLWPHFATLNHSCAPNCVHYVVGDTMVVRAVEAVQPGTELHVSYLGREDLAPRQVRQAALESRYGFRCDCARCRTEAELPQQLQELLVQLYDRSRHELAPRFERLASAAAHIVESGPSSADLDSEEDEEEEEGEALGGEAAAAARRASGGAAAAGPALTAAESAKRALKKASGGASPRWSALLAALEPRLEEAARSLHLALKELQEDDVALDDDDARPAADGGAAAAAADATRRQRLTRLQAAQAASYQLLELVALHAELTAAAGPGLGPGLGPAGAPQQAASSALAACWHVLDTVARGSELQVFQASKLLGDALRTSRPRPGAPRSPPGGSAAPPPPEPVREAAALLGQALLARYGRQRGQQLTALTQAAMRAGKEFF
ncbi:hypothetical protein HYH03_011627 [Edaphochlamys debaryana]|uniref:SET domain-containing protein n=1 Tax=Edaphochlamys debaryana TaxID=47281 RepID=A0A835XU65_9CHLO|nr:hypothetical protein HYH03_011627 [Edaphochlamys debaryana]|eukprot:KAG2489824.1 hypothetical protein HYH03_011627 [Edaphochlamys debaryana]